MMKSSPLIVILLICIVVIVDARSLLSSLNNQNSHLFATTTTTTPIAIQNCTGMDGYNISCPADLACCGVGDIEVSCMNVSTSQCCTWWIGATQCDKTENCCGEMGTGASSSAFCCGGSTPKCCQTQEDGMSQCCTEDSKCCIGENSFCCGNDEECCQESCCTSSQICCGYNCCDIATMYCDQNQECQWITKYPTYSPNAHYKPFDAIWFLNQSQYGSPLFSIEASTTRDFITYFDNSEELIRVNGVTGAVKWKTVVDIAPSLTYFFKAINIAFSMGIGVNVDTGKIVYNTTAQINAVCKNNFDNYHRPDLLYASETHATFQCYSTGYSNWGIIVIMAQSGVIAETWFPSVQSANNMGGTSVSCRTAAKTVATNYVDTSSTNQAGVLSILDVTTAKLLNTVNLPFGTQYETQLVNPSFNLQGEDFSGQITSSASDWGDRLGVIFAQNGGDLVAFSPNAGMIAWQTKTCSFTAMNPFSITLSSAVKKQNRKLAAAAQYVVAYADPNNYIKIVDQVTGGQKFSWTSPKNYSQANPNNCFNFGLSSLFLYVQTQNSILAIDIASSTPSVKWEAKGFNINGNLFASWFSPFLFVEISNPSNQLCVLSPADGSVVHCWNLLPMEGVQFVYVPEGADVVRVITNIGTVEYKL